MKRDLAVPALAALLAVLVLPATGLLDAPWLPQTPEAYHRLALVLCAVFFVAVAPARRTPWRPLLLALTALPFLFFGYLAGPTGASTGWLPATGWFALLAATSAFGLAPRPWVPAGSLWIVLGATTVLAGADLALLPEGWNALAAPVPSAAPWEAEAATTHAEATLVGLREGAPVRFPPAHTPALASGAGPWWGRAAKGARPGPRPVVLLLDGNRRARRTWVTRGVTLVHGSEHAFTHALDLAAIDVLMLRSAAWTEDDPQGRLKARAILAFVRRGGLLVGPAPGRAWPPHVGRALGAAGRQRETGLRSERTLGLGRVTRAATQADVDALLEARMWVPAVSSHLGAVSAVPALPAGLDHWQDRPIQRRPQGVLLLMYAAVLLALGWVVRRPGAQALGVLLVAGAVLAGLVWVSVRDPGVRAHALVTEVGGRRFEAVVLSAGPAGYEGRVHWSGGGVVSLKGAQLTPDGRVRIRPGRTGWVIRETPSPGAVAAELEDRRAAPLRSLLAGEVDPRRLRYGQQRALPIHVEGVGRLPAWTVSYR